MKKLTTILWVAAAVAMSFAHASETKAPPQTTQSEAPAAEQESRISWQTFQATPLAQATIAANQARIVFLRSGPMQDTATPADIYVNGRFHSAVLPGAYAEAFVCAGEHQIEIKSRATAGIDPAKTPSLKVQVKSKQTTYVGLGDPRTPQALRTLAANALPRDVAQLQRQNHAVSRLGAPANCKAQETRYNLASELLFRFGKSDVQDLLSTGEAEIIRLARKIREEHATIEAAEEIMVMGGGEIYRQALPFAQRLYITEVDIEVEEKRKNRFTPPLPDEVQAYITSLSINSFNADQFCNHYSAKGWMIGKNKMKDWKAAVRTWRDRENKDKNSSTYQDDKKRLYGADHRI
jgi:hypothetical protein